MHLGFITKVSAGAALAITLAACGGGPPRDPAIGEAFVGAAELKVRSDLPPNSPPVATVRLGERLQILQVRRQLFVRVRTSGGAEGWVEARQLLAAEDMESLKHLSETARTMPSQGIATVYDDLRVHTLPSRSAPSFLLLKEGDKVDVLADLVVERTTLRRRPLVPPPPKKAKAVKKQKKPPKYPPPPMPAPPGAPENWQELSRTERDPGDEPEVEQPTAPPVPTDVWSLVRAHDGQAGWALTRALVMAIPDEVAQYAERQRIVSYFPLGEVLDGDEKKQQWLWTTVSSGAKPYDFDSFRVFVWSLRRHRYETAYIERNLRGFSPVLLKEVKLTSPRGGEKAEGGYPGFSICTGKADGQRRRREYAFINNSVRLAGETACEPPRDLRAALAPPAGQPSGPPPVPPKADLGERISQQWKALKRKVFGN